MIFLIILFLNICQLSTDDPSFYKTNEKSDSFSTNLTILSSPRLTGNVIEVPEDIDSDGDYDFLILSIEVEISGNIYQEEIIGIFAQVFTTVVYESRFCYDLGIGMSWVDVKIPAQILHEQGINQSYSIRVSLRDGNYDICDEFIYTTEFYSWEEWDPFDIKLTGRYFHECEDLDANGKFDSVLFKFEVCVYEVELIEITVSFKAFLGTDTYIIKTWDYSYSDYLDLGFQNITFTLKNTFVWTLPAEAGVFIDNIQIYSKIDDYYFDQNIPNIHYNLPFVYEYDPPQVWVVKITNDFGVDLNNDGFFEVWRVNFKVNVTKNSFSFNLYAQLTERDPFIYITASSVSKSNLSRGYHTISLEFDGRALYKSKFIQSCAIRYYSIRELSTGELIEESNQRLNLKSSYSWIRFSETPCRMKIDKISKCNESYLVNNKLELIVELKKLYSQNIERGYLVACINSPINKNTIFVKFFDLNCFHTGSEFEKWKSSFYLDYLGYWNITLKMFGSHNAFETKVISFDVEGSLIINHTLSNFLITLGNPLTVTAVTTSYHTELINFQLYDQTENYFFPFELYETNDEFSTWKLTYYPSIPANHSYTLIGEDTLGQKFFLTDNFMVEESNTYFTVQSKESPIEANLFSRIALFSIILLLILVLKLKEKK
ncbi:hypothetical protein [Candidatus Hodarchaeum mangrovi]